jgi:hypothetical protein
MKKELNPNKKLLPIDQDEEVAADGVKVTSKVKLKAPNQRDGKRVYFQVSEPVQVQDLADPEYFAPGRFIANIILDKETAIDPPVDLSIEITPADVQRAAERTFKLAYHDGKKWVVVKENIPCQAGFAAFQLAKIGDPAIGIAP